MFTLRNNIRPLFILCALFLAFGAVLIGVFTMEGGLDQGNGKSTKQDANNTSSMKDYVGSVVCAGCHTQQMQAWRGSHHDLAMQGASAQTILGDFENATFSYNGQTSSFFSKDGEFWIKTEGPDGMTQEFQVVHSFGVTPLQQYLVAMPGGRLQALPFAWDSREKTKGGQRWFHLYAEENVQLRDRLHWSQALQNWNGMCADCHSTGLKRNLDPNDLSFNTLYKEEDVACEACHGPGGAHTAQAQSASPRTAGSSTDILSYQGMGKSGNWLFTGNATTAHWSGNDRARTEIETCAGCHSRRAALDDGFAPGAEYLDNFIPALIEPGIYHADGQIRDEVYVYGSFLQSKMHGANVTCSDCHDPHSLKLRFEKNAVCTQCHSANVFDTPDHHNHKPESAGSDCANCHMPETIYMGVDARRDHSIRIPRPDISAKFGTPNACNKCHTDKGSKWATSAIERWSGTPQTTHHDQMASAFTSAWRGDPSVMPQLSALATNTELPGIVRASAYVAMTNMTPGVITSSAVPTLEQGLKDSDPMVRLGAIRATAILSTPERIHLLAPRLSDERRANRIEAARLLADIPPNAMPTENQEDKISANKELVSAATQGLWRGETGLNLGQFYDALGATRKAKTAYETALQADPYFTPARINLAAHAQRQKNELASGIILKQGLASLPGDADLNHAYGLHLVRSSQHQAALAYLKTAAESAPQTSRYAYVYGAALNSLGNQAEALRVYERALSLAPNDINLLYALASLHARAGNRLQARKHALLLQKYLPNDPAVKQLLRNLQD